jgi:hypothetical protein
MTSTYKLDYLTEVRILTTLRVRISTLIQRRKESREAISHQWANNWFNKDIREAIDTYRRFRAALTA